MRHNLLWLSLLFYPAANAFAIDWPVKETGNTKISSTFGESRIDHFHNGLDIPGKGFDIYSVGSGKLIYSHSDFSWPGEIPFGGGNTVVVEHTSSLSGYMHLEEHYAPKQSLITREEPIGTAGNTGHSGGAHLHFFIYDKKEDAYLNPLLLLPDSTYPDLMAPKILQYGVLLPDRLATVNIDESFTMTADYPICAQIVDSSGNNERWGVYQVDLFSKGKPTRSIKFDRIFWKKDLWVIDNGLAFHDIYVDNFLCLGKGYRDKNELHFEARGYQGPGVKVQKKLKIKLEE